MRTHQRNGWETKEDELSRAPSDDASTASKNLCVTHNINKLKIAKVNTVNMAYADALHKAGINSAHDLETRRTAEVWSRGTL